MKNKDNREEIKEGWKETRKEYGVRSISFRLLSYGHLILSKILYVIAIYLMR